MYSFFFEGNEKRENPHESLCWIQGKNPRKTDDLSYKVSDKEVGEETPFLEQ